MKLKAALKIKERTNYKNRFANWYEKVASYYYDYYLTNPSRNLDSLLTESIDLIDIAIKRDYKQFIDIQGAEFKDTIRKLVTKKKEIDPDDELIGYVFNALIEFDFYSSKGECLK